jgi:hypothetical protein
MYEHIYKHVKLCSFAASMHGLRAGVSNSNGFEFFLILNIHMDLAWSSICIYLTPSQFAPRLGACMYMLGIVHLCGGGGLVRGCRLYLAITTWAMIDWCTRACICTRGILKLVVFGWLHFIYRCNSTFEGCNQTEGKRGWQPYARVQALPMQQHAKHV